MAAFLTLAFFALATASWLLRGRWPALIYVQFIAATLALYCAIQWLFRKKN